MALSQMGKHAVMIALCMGLAACGGNSFLGRVTAGDEPTDQRDPFDGTRASMGGSTTGSSFWDLFGADRTDQTVSVNRYLWNASLDVLDFLPIQSVDPFTGVIVTGYGTPPGGGRAYRATVHVTDPALEARALRVSLQSRNGPVSAGTARAVEDAILARARQMRIADNRF
ncbi:DUF3576 domain-containing protein [Aestuariivita sp.]|jgi:hypothetical protein|uniref:DUF3576 domain-containing protein n=1 Tax=Aestuariivita sp. TaxID=1872407 RepID=UPI0025BF0B51|nr:DUF3576 domain-containing protein [Aestuariivita sp.]